MSHHKVLFTMLPYILFWKDKSLHFYNDNDLLFLKRAITITNRYVILKITLFPHASILHANIALYDKKTNTLRRFEPYGDWEFIDSYSLDEYLIHLFSKCINQDETKGKIKYLRPGDYLRNFKIQLLTLDHDPDKKNLGDPVGYCLAWCFWFVELKLKNPDIVDDKLIEESLNSIINGAPSNDDNPLLTYIRKYAANLDKEKNDLLEKIGLDKKDIYGLSYSDDKINKIGSYIKKYCESIL